MKSIFTPEQEKLADIILENNHLSPLNELYSKEIKELAVIWSYYSGKIQYLPPLQTISVYYFDS